jgi:hypothetical protein
MSSLVGRRIRRSAFPRRRARLVAWPRNPASAGGSLRPGIRRQPGRALGFLTGGQPSGQDPIALRPGGGPAWDQHAGAGLASADFSAAMTAVKWSGLCRKLVAALAAPFLP